MPPKKEESTKRVLLGAHNIIIRVAASRLAFLSYTQPPPPPPPPGRPGNHVKMGIVGLPNVGKSSMFNLLCSMHVPAEN